LKPAAVSGQLGASAAPAPRAAPAGAALRLERLTKRFGAVTAVDEVSLDIPAGSFVTLLGPSGSGKTTTLNLIAGFLMPDAGEIWSDGRSLSAVPPHKRNIGMVFQSYALFPHMTVLDNVAYPLRMRERLDRAAMRERVSAALALVQLAGYEARYPRQLSGASSSGSPSLAPWSRGRAAPHGRAPRRPRQAAAVLSRQRQGLAADRLQMVAR
jgi:ABC-type proline/glycine betaine transport system ATPase subunit